MKRTATLVLLVLLCTASFGLMLGSSLRDSLVVDELAHIPAGYAYIHLFDYRLNPEHPPLMKALAALPLLFMHINFPASNPFWATAVNGEWGVGGALLFGGQNNPYAIIDWARAFPILLTIGLILFIFFWSKKLFGPIWALLPAALTGLSPIILAQGHYVTTDLAAAFGCVLGLYTFISFLEKRTRIRLLIAGIGFGIAQVMKFSALVLIPVYAVILIFFAIASRRQGHAPEDSQPDGTDFRRLGLPPGRALVYFVIIILIGYAAIVYPLYAIFTAHYPPARQVSDTTALIGGTANLPCNVLKPSTWIPCAAKADIYLAPSPVTRPLAQYLLGVIMDSQRVLGTNIGYFLGEVYQSGTRLYFPILYLTKEALPALILIAIGSVLALGRILRSIFKKRTQFSKYVREHLTEFSLFVFVAVYWAWSVNSSLNIGIRHLLPTIPFMYMLAASSLRRSVQRPSIGHQAPDNLQPKILFVAAMVVWLVFETAFAYPYYLSYYNELAGGTADGYRIAADSNYDWGQDMYALQDWMGKHPEADKLALDFFGGSNPAYYLGNRYVPWQSSMGNPAAQGIHWFAASINNLQIAIQPTAPGYSRSPADSYAWLTALRPPEPGMGGVPAPDYRIGTTIFVYKL
ncbi:MAG: glycosyltransferase family 39 protein [Patescibacteria group bacterium]|nr:glycosyltransferase family 39 protein [Patescibacteria group bacterium]